MSSGCSGTLDHLDNAIQKLQSKTIQQIAMQVAEAGVQAAIDAYQAASLLPNDSLPHATQTHWDGDSLCVELSGVGMFFIEFGTGIFQGGTEFGLEHGMSPASWSDAHSGWLVSPKVELYKGWWPISHAKTWTKGQPPADAAGAATEAMKEAVATAFKTIWNGG